MQVILETDEAWSLISLITSYVIDNSGVSQDGKQRIRGWRGEHDGTPKLEELTAAINGSLGSYGDEKTTRQIRKKGRFAKQAKGAAR
ncbi:MAG: hypothetical protein IH957_02445 [Chloroflexi bacterium]|nr:hypothetical protein [Chloroflexota bacterium]